MKEPLDFARGLVTKADHDLRMAEIGNENEAPLDAVAFHLQQCAEKLIKAFLNWKEIQYPKTHSLGALLDLAVRPEADLEAFRTPLLGMASYAVEMRYDDELYPSDIDRHGRNQKGNSPQRRRERPDFSLRTLPSLQPTCISGALMFGVTRILKLPARTKTKSSLRLCGESPAPVCAGPP